MPRQPLSTKNTLSAPAEGFLWGSESRHTGCATWPLLTTLSSETIPQTLQPIMWASHELHCLPTRCLFCLFCVLSAWEGHPDIRGALWASCLWWYLLPSGLTSVVMFCWLLKTGERANGPQTAFPTPPATNGCITTRCLFHDDECAWRRCVACVCVSVYQSRSGKRSHVISSPKKQKTHNRYKNKLRSKFLLHFPLLLWLFACLASNQKFTWKVAVIPFPYVLNEYKPACMFADFMFLEFET